MRLLYATTNQAKLESMRRITKILGVEIIGLNELKKLSEFANVQLPQIDETGNNPLENAIIKARAYYDTLKIPLFSCDSGLYFDDLEAEQSCSIWQVSTRHTTASQCHPVSRHSGRMLHLQESSEMIHINLPSKMKTAHNQALNL